MDIIRRINKDNESSRRAVRSIYDVLVDDEMIKWMVWPDMDYRRNMCILDIHKAVSSRAILTYGNCYLHGMLLETQKANELPVFYTCIVGEALLVKDQTNFEIRMPALIRWTVSQATRELGHAFAIYDKYISEFMCNGFMRNCPSSLISGSYIVQKYHNRVSDAFEGEGS